MSRENDEFVRLWWDGFNKEGVPVLDLCHEKVDIRIPDEFPFTGHYHGHAGVRRWAAEVFDTIDRHRVEVEEVIQTPDDETVVMALRSHGRWKHMDLDFTFPWVAVWTIRNGRLVYAHGYLTREEALEAVGLPE